MKSQYKVLYFSNPFYLDYDLPLIRHLAKETDLFYFIDISPLSTQATILKIENFIKTTGILDGTTYGIEDQYDDLPRGKTWIINRKTNKLSLSNLFLQFRLALLIKNINPDIIHFNIDFNHNYFLLYFLLKIPFVCTVHDPIPHADNNTFREALKRRIFYRYIKNYIILNSEQRDEFISRYKLQKKHVFISTLSIYDYILPDTTLPVLNRLHLPGDSIQILFFGRINKYKGVKYLLSAFRSIISKFPDTQLVIAGKGDLDVNNIESYKNVSFINRYIKSDELSRLISESDFVVCPYTDATQSGVIMTAFAFCKPVIATNVGGLKNFVIDGVTGLLIEPGNTEKLGEAIGRFIQHPELLDRISSNILDRYHTGDSKLESNC